MKKMTMSMGAVVAVTAVAAILSNAAIAAPFNVCDFGAKGDGVTD